MSLLFGAVVLMQLAQQAHSKVIFVPAKEVLHQVRTAAEGSPEFGWIYLVKAPGYTAETVRRTSPARAEVHTGVDDVWYVIEGGGTLVTGGSLVQGVKTEPGEIRGRSIAGGESRHIAKGDFAEIPAGVPHWISKVDGEIIYLIVKPASHE
jgi:mannose-6-phosphate isomerase-like protein (cupin superfamily)